MGYQPRTLARSLGNFLYNSQSGIDVSMRDDSQFSPAEFQARVRASRRVVLPVLILWLLFIFAGPLGLFAVVAPPFEAALRAGVGISPDSADLIWLGLTFGVVPVVLLLGLLSLYRHYGLFCPECGPWSHYFNFVNYVRKHGTCPKCACRVVDLA